MARAGKPFRFAFSPPPVDGELLSSWLHRMAIGHAASGLEFTQLAGGDIVWRPPSELLVQLACGSDLPVSRLRAMTLSAGGVIAPVFHVTPAPAFLVELQSAAKDASRGVAPDERWLIHDPALFLRAISRLVDLIMLKATHDPYSSGLGQLVGHAWPQARTMGETSWSANWIGRMPTPVRVQALAGVASLLANPSGGLSASLTAWFGDKPNPRPWGRVGGEWGPGQLIAARNFIAAWPDPLRREAAEGLGHCITALQRRGYHIPT